MEHQQQAGMVVTEPLPQLVVRELHTLAVVAVELKMEGQEELVPVVVEMEPLLTQQRVMGLITQAEVEVEVGLMRRLLVAQAAPAAPVS